MKHLQQWTICFSKNDIIPDNIIGMYINKYYFWKGRFSESVPV
ncbi:iso-IS1 ORF2 [Microscilla marina ATCC 23134]|uniref:Iso-IS1 ORF2 n=1 Tax=Microscilla marina ATCC 23134 TaxID=313606 RepID=A1ZYK9_MICM2|nr:iso-IS1 ORF2 [Microscilla marina ATCC 23134]